MAAFFTKKSLINYISDTVEVGFYQYGPALTLGGVLTANKQVILIDHISVSVHPPFQSITKEFNWFTLQPHSALENQFDIVDPPTKFTLSSGDSHKYSIMFVDYDCYAEIKTTLLSVISSWRVLQENATPKQKKEGAFNHFCSIPIAKELNSFLQNSCYWQSGEYKIDICITAKNDCFTTQKKFYLNDDDVEQLKNNSSNIIASTCSQPSIQYTTIKTKLIDS